MLHIHAIAKKASFGSRCNHVAGVVEQADHYQPGHWDKAEGKPSRDFDVWASSRAMISTNSLTSLIFPKTYALFFRHAHLFESLPVCRPVTASTATSPYRQQPQSSPCYPGGTEEMAGVRESGGCEQPRGAPDEPEADGTHPQLNGYGRTQVSDRKRRNLPPTERMEPASCLAKARLRGLVRILSPFAQPMPIQCVSIAVRTSISGRTPPMKFVVRLFLSVPLMTVVGFCLFGFLATFEPMPIMHQWTWRGVYASVGATSLITLGWMWLGRSRTSTQARHD